MANLSHFWNYTPTWYFLQYRDNKKCWEKRYALSEKYFQGPSRECHKLVLSKGKRRHPGFLSYVAHRQTHTSPAHRWPLSAWPMHHISQCSMVLERRQREITLFYLREQTHATHMPRLPPSALFCRYTLEQASFCFISKSPDYFVSSQHWAFFLPWRAPNNHKVLTWRYALQCHSNES